MKKYYILSFIAFFALASMAAARGQESGGGSQGMGGSGGQNGKMTGAQSAILDPTDANGGVDSQNGIGGQNRGAGAAGEDPKEQQQGYGAEEELQAQQRSQISGETQQNRFQNTYQRMIHLGDQYQDDDQGEKIKALAENQLKIQKKISGDIDLLKERGAINRFFFGADRAAQQDAQVQLQLHQEQVNRLRAVENETVDPGDKAMLQEQIRVTQQIQVDLQDEVHEGSVGGPGLLGWIFN